MKCGPSHCRKSAETTPRGSVACAPPPRVQKNPRCSRCTPKDSSNVSSETRSKPSSIQNPSAHTARTKNRTYTVKNLGMCGKNQKSENSVRKHRTHLCPALILLLSLPCSLLFGSHRREEGHINRQRGGGKWIYTFTLTVPSSWRLSTGTRVPVPVPQTRNPNSRAYSYGKYTGNRYSNPRSGTRPGVPVLQGQYRNSTSQIQNPSLKLRKTPRPTHFSS